MNDAPSPKKKTKNPNKAKPNSPFKPVPKGSLESQLASLEANNKALVDVVNANGAIMRDCLEVTEARQWMIMRAMDDAGMGEGTKRVGEHNSGPVDWEHYKGLYLEFQTELQKQAAETPPEDGTSADDVVFGGEG